MRRAALVPVVVLAASGCAMRSDVVRIERQLVTQQQAQAHADSLIASNVAGLGRLLQSVADSLAAQQLRLTQLRGDTRIDELGTRNQILQKLLERAQLEKQMRRCLSNGRRSTQVTPRRDQIRR